MPKKKKFKLVIKLDNRPIGNRMLDEKKAASVARAVGMSWPTAFSTADNGPLSYSLKEIR